MLEELDYLDEVFAPMGMDDQDICYRAWEIGWVSGLYPMPHFSDPSWGTTRNNLKSLNITSASERKNWPILRQRHQAAMLDVKHDEDRLLEC
jgi:GT2 family glycosyltransferase